VAANCVSITPLKIDLTRYEALDSLRAWMGAVNEAR
jgi:hypothetical protein